jgi:hypothetical protein
MNQSSTKLHKVMQKPRSYTRIFMVVNDQNHQTDFQRFRNVIMKRENKILHNTSCILFLCCSYSISAIRPDTRMY